MRFCVLGFMSCGFRSTLLLFAAISCLAQVVPVTKTETLNGTSVVFPKPGGTKPLLLVLGFSHSSSGDLDNWNRLTKDRYWSDPRIEYYELVDLQDVPSFIKMMILHGMRRGVQKAEQSHFAPFYSDEGKWKSLVHYSEARNVYFVIADPAGHVVWQGHGPATAEKCGELESALAKIGH